MVISYSVSSLRSKIFLYVRSGSAISDTKMSLRTPRVATQHSDSVACTQHRCGLLSGPDLAGGRPGKKGKGSPYSITERRVPEMIPVLGSQPAGDAAAAAPPFNGPFSGTTRLNRYKKGKPIWILLKQETVSGSDGINWAVCKSASRSRQITTPAPQATCPSCRPTDSINALKHRHIPREYPLSRSRL